MQELTPGHLPRTYYAKSRNAVERWGLAPSHWDPPGTSPRYARGSSAAIKIAKEILKHQRCQTAFPVLLSVCSLSQAANMETFAFYLRLA